MNIAPVGFNPRTQAARISEAMLQADVAFPRTTTSALVDC